MYKVQLLYARNFRSSEKAKHRITSLFLSQPGCPFSKHRFMEPCCVGGLWPWPDPVCNDGRALTHASQCQPLRHKSSHDTILQGSKERAYRCNAPYVTLISLGCCWQFLRPGRNIPLHIASCFWAGSCWVEDWGTYFWAKGRSTSVFEAGNSSACLTLFGSAVP